MGGGLVPSDNRFFFWLSPLCAVADPGRSRLWGTRWLPPSVLAVEVGIQAPPSVYCIGRGTGRGTRMYISVQAVGRKEWVGGEGAARFFFASSLLWQVPACTGRKVAVMLGAEVASRTWKLKKLVERVTGFGIAASSTDAPFSLPLHLLLNLFRSSLSLRIGAVPILQARKNRAVPTYIQNRSQEGSLVRRRPTSPLP